jgi:tetratricopeptide (TPR) repeat protein
VELWEQLEYGIELSNAGRHDAARKVFDASLRADPDNVLALKFLGADALRRGDLRQAIALNARVARSGLHVADALSNLSVAHYRAGDLTAAIERGREAVRADPGHAAARANLALALMEAGNASARQGNTRAALNAFQEAAGLDPGNLDVIERLGAALHRDGRLAEARARFESVVASAPDRRAPQLSLAILDLESGRPGDAAARLERLRDGWPGAYQAQFYLGEAYRQLGDAARARAAYEAAASMAPAGDPIAGAARRAGAAVR